MTLENENPASCQTAVKCSNFCAANQCPEFPFFGARYPDATCIDGYLWDLDNCDENGLISTGDNPPCPFCNTDAFIDYHTEIDDNQLNEMTKDSDLSEEDKNEILKSHKTKEDVIKWVEALKNKYIIKETSNE